MEAAITTSPLKKLHPHHFLHLHHFLLTVISLLHCLVCFHSSSPVFGSAAALNSPLSSSPSVPTPAASDPVNITHIIESAGEFQTFVSLLTATGVNRLFQARANRTTTSGITVFAPTDQAFSASNAVSKLSARHKIDLLEFHALSAFYPLSALQQATVPAAPTLATAAAGAGKFTVNLTNADGAVLVSTPLSRATLISTLYNTVPCAVFAIDQVLLPEELFGLPKAHGPSEAPLLGGGAGASITPASSLASNDGHNLTPATQTPNPGSSSPLTSHAPSTPTPSTSCPSCRVTSRELVVVATLFPMFSTLKLYKELH